MDPFAGLLPSQPVSIYRNLILIGSLGVTQTVLSCLCIFLAVTGVALHKEMDLGSSSGYWLSAKGICVGIFALLTGTWGFLTKLALIKPRVRHCMFLIGILLTMLAAGLCFAMCFRSLKEWRRSAKEVSHPNAKANCTALVMSANVSSPQDGPSSTAAVTLEDSNQICFPITGLLRAVDAIIYLLLGSLFLTSVFLNCQNIRRIMKNGEGFLPHYEVSWLPAGCLGKRKQPGNVTRVNRGDISVIDKNGSLWVLPQGDAAAQNLPPDNGTPTRSP
ncbi:hypothetical protein BV898_00730 [Hypsibius exemplaris]|uniref:Uncharacterized protein n=1 Tax=Hypsibius exemplaris TaxID=2072580 RepID=A0A1W0XED4_HYPEX|nr:hypothetical protein BV898_00730 [Hypsibius exemplaris]